tara:strand:+ start:1200 stop:1412 length:213 start_codon:yes stop_codon:yes gene_type:complete
MSKHHHRFGPWILHKVGKGSDLPDKEYIRSRNFPPFWVQKCECGFENWYRDSTRPKASMKFREMWKSRAL